MSWIDDIGKDEFFKGMADAMKGNATPGKPKVGSGDIDTEEAKRNFKKFIDQVKDTTKGTKMWQTALEGGQVPIVDITDTIKDFDEAIAKSKDATERDILIERRQQAMRTQVNAALRASAVNLTTGFAQAAYGLITGSLDLAKGLIEGKSAIALATESMVMQIKAQAKVVSTIGDSLSQLGFLATLLPIGRGIKIAFVAITSILGPLLKLTAEKSAELAEKGLSLLQSALEQTRKGFYTLAGQGVIFADGMTGMINSATRAGMRVEDFAEVVRENGESIQQMGGGMIQATQRLAGISGEIRKGQLGLQLRNLGFDLKEQGKVAADAAAQLNYSGQLRKMSDIEVAKYTVQYAKDLKVLQNITGQDAQKAMERARKEALAADVRAKLLREGGPEALKNFEKVYATVPEALKKGFLENIASGGTAIADVTTNILMSANPAVKQYLDASRDIILNARPEEIAVKSGQLLETLGKSGLQANSMLESISAAGRLGNNQLLSGVTEAASQITEIGIKLQEGTTVATNNIIEAGKRTKDELTGGVHALDEATNKAAVELQQNLIPTLKTFTAELKKQIPTLTQSMDYVSAGLAKLVGENADKAGQTLDEKNRNHMFMVEKLISHTRSGVESVVGMFSENTAKSMEASRRKEESEYIKSRERAVALEKKNQGRMTDSEKTVSNLAFAVEDFIAVVPSIGPMIAESLYKSRQENTEKYLNETPMEKRKDKGFFRNLIGFSKGGITNTPAIFGESGPEAAVPLPDGRRIPVNVNFDDLAKGVVTASRLSGGASLQGALKTMMTGMPNADSDLGGGIAEMMRKIYDEMMPNRNQNKEMLDIQEAGKDTSLEIKYLLEAQISKQDQMIRYLKDNVDVSNRMLSLQA